MAHIIGGVIAIALGLIGILGWWEEFGDFLRGGVPLALFIGGLIAVATGLQLRTEPAEEEAEGERHRDAQEG